MRAREWESKRVGEQEREWESERGMGGCGRERGRERESGGNERERKRECERTRERMWKRTENVHTDLDLSLIVFLKDAC